MIAVRPRIELEHAYRLELRPRDDSDAVPLHVEDVSADLADLVEEAFAEAVLSDRLPATPPDVSVVVSPRFEREPVVAEVEVRLRVELDGGSSTVVRRFRTGRWARTARRALLALHEEGRVGKGVAVVRSLCAQAGNGGRELETPYLALPPILERSLADLGVRELGEGSIDPRRPVLVARRLADEAVARCEEAGVREAGGVALGALVRLDEPLEGAQTRIITLLTSLVVDDRHVGRPGEFALSPDALVDARSLADLRGNCESVAAIVHSHGWSRECARCHENPDCPIPEAVPSLDDYALLESLLPAKSSLLPIVGRKRAASGRRPLLRVFCWRSGRMQEIPWTAYEE